MIRLLVQYRVKADAVDQVQQVVTQFVDDIRANEPNTIYGAFVAADGRSFFHAMAFPDEQAAKRHRSAAHTRRFVELLYSNCEEEPHFIQLELVRSTKKGGGFLGMG
jgi:quinol monooxygenase YgiN